MVHDGRNSDLVEATETGQYSSDKEAASQPLQRNVKTPGEAVGWTKSVAKGFRKVDINEEGMIVADTSGSTVKMLDNSAMIVDGRQVPLGPRVHLRVQLPGTTAEEKEKYRSFTSEEERIASI